MYHINRREKSKFIRQMSIFFRFLKIFENHPFIGVGNTQKVYTTQLASVKLKTILHYIFLFHDYLTNAS